MCKREIPRGHALIRLADLAALLAGQPPPGAAAAEPPAQAEDAWEGLASAVAMLTARLGRCDIDLSQLADGAGAESVIGPLVAMAAAGLRHCLTEDGAGKFLRDMGAIAANRGRGPDGRAL